MTLPEVGVIDIAQAKKDYPYFSNLSLLKMRKNKDLNKNALFQNASYLPDRKHLYFTLNGSASAAADITSAQKMSSFTSPEITGPQAKRSGRIVVLPKYEKPQVGLDTDVAEDEDLSQLEEKLLGRMNEESNQTTVAAVHNDGSSDPPPPKSNSILSEFDRSVNRNAFGNVSSGAKSPGANFLDWLTAMDQNPYSADEESDTAMPQEDIIPIVDGNKYENVLKRADQSNNEDKNKKKKHESDAPKSKKKSKKIAKLLAKKSIQPDTKVASETLAQILVQQGHFEEAIKMYQRLILHNPEKSKTFAAVIEKLKEKRT